MLEKHLKSHQYYVDLYDRGTVERCRRLDKPSVEPSEEELKEKNISKEQNALLDKGARDLLIHIEAGERYLNKEKTIREWMESDEKKDYIYESAQAPEDIRCLTCRNRLKSTFKELWYEDGKEDRVLFMYDCVNKCLPRRAFFSEGEEWRTKPHLCKNCNTPTDHTSEDMELKIITKYSCSKCGNVETDEYVKFVKEEEEIDEKYPADRDRFCLTDEDGKKYQEEKWNFQQLSKFLEEMKEKDDARQKKLEENPKGFHLEGAGYTCAICHGSTPEGDNWYDQYGIKCLVCQKAIDEGEIPPHLAKDKDCWYTKYDIERSFNVKSPTLAKWVRQGIIKPRIVSHYGKGTHYELFMIEDNKDFLPPKNLVESEYVNVKDGDKVEKRNVPWYQLYNPHERLKGYKIMDHLRVVPPEEVKEMEEAKKKKAEAKQARREALRKKKSKS